MATILKEKVMREGLTAAQVIWIKFRRQPKGFLEKVIALNPVLAESDFVPLGTEISFPVEELAAADEAKDVVRLWD